MAAANSSVAEHLAELDSAMGDTTTMTTTASTVAGAINELDTTLGDIDNLTGYNLAAANSSVAEHLAELDSAMGDTTTMTTTASTVAGAINELDTTLGDIDNLTGYNLAAANSSVAEHLTELNSVIGNTPMTTDATTLTGAIAEIAAEAAYNITDPGRNFTVSNFSNNIIELDSAIGDIQDDITVASNGTYNYIAAGSDVAANLVLLDTNVKANADDIDDLNTTLGDIAGLNGNNLAAANSSVAQHLDALDDAIGNRDYTGSSYINANESVAESLVALDAQITTLNADENTDGSVANTVKTAAAYADYDSNATYADNTIGAAIDTLNTTLGDVDSLNGGNLANQDSSVTEHLASLDSAIGNRNYTNVNYIAANESVADSLVTLDSQVYANEQNIGDMSFTGTYAANETSLTGAVNALDDQIAHNASDISGIQEDITVASNGNYISAGSNVAANLGALDTQVNANAEAIATNADHIGSLGFTGTYAAGSQDLTSAVNALDAQIAANTNQINHVEHKLDKVEYNLKSGLAAVTALSALVPNARDCGDTQLSVGTGMYSNRMGVAVGGFHYLNDHILLNAGASFGGAKDLAFRAGITFGL